MAKVKTIGIADDQAKRVERTICLNIRILLASQQLDQRGLAEALGMTDASISRKMNGITSWSITDLVNTAVYLHVPLERIISSRTDAVIDYALGPSSVEPPAGFGPTTC